MNKEMARLLWSSKSIFSFMIISVAYTVFTKTCGWLKILKKKNNIIWMVEHELHCEPPNLLPHHQTMLQSR